MDFTSNQKTIKAAPARLSHQLCDNCKQDYYCSCSLFVINDLVIEQLKGVAFSLIKCGKSYRTYRSFIDRLQNISAWHAHILRVLFELSYIQLNSPISALRSIVFQIAGRFLLVVPAFKNVGERSTAKNYGPISLISVVSKVFENL